MVPKSFTIFGEKHKVSFVKKIDKEDSLGEWNPNKNTIKIKKGLQEDMKEQTFYHELVHCILQHLSYEELTANEVFVDRFGKVLHQAIKTME